MRPHCPSTPACRFHRGDGQKGFSLIELLVSTTIFVSILAVLFGSLDMSQKSWMRAHAQLSQYREAQTAFETMSRRISDSVLNTHWGYDRLDSFPDEYVRKSQLHFVSGPASAGDSPLLGSDYPPSHAIFFHAPFGLHDNQNWQDFSVLLNGWGYYIDYGSESNVPAFLGGDSRNRFRLIELQIPADEMTTYEDDLQRDPPQYNLYEWFQNQIDAGHSRPLAENIIALIIAPEAPEQALTNPYDIAPAYLYDTRAWQKNIGSSENQERSKHQLPPLLRITLVGIDETSALRLQKLNGSARPDFGLERLFINQQNYSSDLETLETELQRQNINYRVFSTVIRLRNARWSDTN